MILFAQLAVAFFIGVIAGALGVVVWSGHGLDGVED
jgi:hypothetical protein